MSVEFLTSDELSRQSSLPPATDPTRLALFATVLSRVKPFPLVVQQVRDISENRHSTVVDVARALEQDVGLTADVLRIVNAPTSGLAKRCTSVRHAVALLGLGRVANVVAGAAALKFVEQSSALAPEVAAHAIAVAGVARMLASYTGTSPDEAFVTGLLHDVGVLLLLQQGDSFYEELLEQAGGAEVGCAEEQMLLGFDHAVAGGHTLRAWSLPSPLPEAVELHHDWDGAMDAGGATLALVAIVRTADILVPRLLAHESPRFEDLDLARTEASFGCIGLSRDELYNMWAGLRLACHKANTIGGTREPTREPRSSSVPVRPAKAPLSPAQAWTLAAVVAFIMALAFVLRSTM